MLGAAGGHRRGAGGGGLCGRADARRGGLAVCALLTIAVVLLLRWARPWKSPPAPAAADFTFDRSFVHRSAARAAAAAQALPSGASPARALAGAAPPASSSASSASSSSSAASPAAPAALPAAARAAAHPPVTAGGAGFGVLARPRERVVVTGGAGFVGSHLVDVLLSAGHSVTVIDDLSTGSRSNLAHWSALPPGSLAVIEADVAALPAPARAALAAADRVYHLACPASPAIYAADMPRTLRTAVEGTRAVLEAARGRVLLASTSEVYGDPETHPQPEAYRGSVSTMGPRSAYDEGKRAGEALAYAYARQRGADVRVARIFNTYGPRMHPRDGRVVSSFVAAAAAGAGGKLIVQGDGKQTRSLQYVSDLVAGLVALMHSDSREVAVPAEVGGGGGEGAAAYAGPFAVNLGSSDEITVAALAARVLAVVGGGATVVHAAAAADDPRQRRADRSRAAALLRWAPRVPLDDGLRATAAYVRRALGLAPASGDGGGGDGTYVVAAVRAHLADMAAA
jgi:UDP-glucuronate decarboxylase